MLPRQVVEHADRADSTLTRFEQAINATGMKTLQPFAVLSRGRIAELRGQCDQAIKHYQAAQQLDPAEASMHMRIGRCYRELGQIPQSIEHLQMTLKVIPAHARANYEMGLAQLAAGDTAEAVKYLRKAVVTWARADSGYRVAAGARARLRELDGRLSAGAGR